MKCDFCISDASQTMFFCTHQLCKDCFDNLSDNLGDNDCPLCDNSNTNPLVPQNPLKDCEQSSPNESPNHSKDESFPIIQISPLSQSSPLIQSSPNDSKDGNENSPNDSKDGNQSSPSESDPIVVIIKPEGHLYLESAMENWNEIQKSMMSIYPKLRFVVINTDRWGNLRDSNISPHAMKYTLYGPVVLLIPGPTWNNGSNFKEGVIIMNGTWDRDFIKFEREYNIQNLSDWGLWLTNSLLNEDFQRVQNTSYPDTIEVVINDCYGGFGLSDTAMKALNHIVINTDIKQRADPNLIRVVKELGVKVASGECAHLKIVQLPFHCLTSAVIHDYDGYESIELRCEQVFHKLIHQQPAFKDLAIANKFLNKLKHQSEIMVAFSN